MRYRHGIILPITALLAACGSGSVATGSVPTPPPPTVTPAYRVVDLATGAVTGQPAGWDPVGTGPSSVVFIRIPAGSHRVGTAQPLAADEAARTATVPETWIASHELTRAQWTIIAGTAPWTLLSSPATIGGASGDRLPASGMTHDEAVAALAAYGKARLGLPSDDAWEVAVRAGSTATYPWGENDAADIIALHTRTWESGTAPGSGPAVVGSLFPNAWGIYDGLGNVAEFTTATGGTATLRGGGWTANRTELRPAARQTIPTDRRHALAGLRLILIP